MGDVVPQSVRQDRPTETEHDFAPLFASLDLPAAPIYGDLMQLLDGIADRRSIRSQAVVP